MYSYTLDEKFQPLKLLTINFPSRPDNWQSQIITLQNHYLEQRGESAPKSIKQTLNLLSVLASSYDMVDYLEKEKVQAISWAAIGLEEIHQLFLDNAITEAFCSELGAPIVITHRTYGRCLTNILFSKEFWESFKIRAEFDTGSSLSSLTPALKFSLETPLGNMRVSLQIPPLTPQSPSFNIRRLPSQPITLDNLVDQQQIDTRLAIKLEEAILKRQCIIIAGEPGSGKTTLANALLLKSDPQWRLIIMEDAREIAVNTKNFPMATRFFMPSVGDNERFSRRADEIARLLHRSPDYVFLGELQNADDTKVAFEGFAAGIRGMATTHARDIAGLESRWINSHRLEPGLLNSIDLIVFTKREIINGISHLSTQKMYQRVGEQFKEV